ncbi:proton-coupled amino acid transporter-like protein pathetic isoform X2 [Vespula squamosa]|uniref:Proton-coupled amino acid transporter-like protein pathetic isoform X2 n=1 Tax=Vespula squamosa TaxID=30214 RepID=A0ABD2A3J0_VESSQ
MSILFSIGINYIIPVKIIWPIIMHYTNINHHFEILFRLVGIILLAIFAIAIPRMIPLTGLLAAVGMTTTMLFIPMLVEINTKWQKATYILYIKSGLIFAIFILILVI